MLPTSTVVEHLIDDQNRRVSRKVNGTITHRWPADGTIAQQIQYVARAVSLACTPATC